MKLVMINDCSGVGETLLKHIPSTIERQHIQRSREFWSKTFGIAYKILKAKGDVYHTNYLLQDCYVALRLGKRPMVGYALGSDVRTTLRHHLWSRVVRHNLKKCDKVLVSTPDILGLARQLRTDTEYLPPPVDMELFHVRPPVKHDGKKKVLIASNVNWNVKGTDIAIRALSHLKNQVDISIIQYGSDFDKTVSTASSLDMTLKILPMVPRQQMREYYWNSDVVIDQFRYGCAGMVALEAIACGRPVVTYVTSKYEEYSDFPIKDLTGEYQIADAIEKADHKLWEKEYGYLEKKHKPESVVKRILSIYDSLVSARAF